jgi:hypothetical protein
MDACPFCNSASIEEEYVTCHYSCGSTYTRSSLGYTYKDNCSAQNPADAEAALWKAMIETDRLFNRSISILDELLPWPNELAALYLQLQIALAAKETTQGKDSNEILLLHACVAVRHELAAGVLSLLRGRVNDSMHNTRKAVEFAMFAAWGIEKDGAATAWLCAVNSDEQWQTYRDAFKIHSLLNASKWKRLAYQIDSLKRLFDDYEQASKRVHATFLSAGSELINRADLVALSIKDSYGSEIEPEILQEVFVWTLHVHLDILDVLEKLMKHLACGPEEGWVLWFETVKKSILSLGLPTSASET